MAAAVLFVVAAISDFVDGRVSCGSPAVVATYQAPEDRLAVEPRQTEPVDRAGRRAERSRAGAPINP